MSAVLSRNTTNIEKVTLFMDECRRMGIRVLGPDVNESKLKFNVNDEGNIRFGLSAIKGVGESAAEKIIEERTKNGNYRDIYDFIERVDLHSVNKKSIESLAMAGAFDNLGNINRSQYFAENGKEITFIETLVRYGSKYQNDKNTQQQSLFGDSGAVEISKPQIPEAPEWDKLVKLNKEKDLVGIYISAHPLDDFKLEMEHFVRTELKDLNSDFNSFKNKELIVGGIVTSVKHAVSKNNKHYGRFTLQDYTDTYEFFLFGKDYQEFRKFLYQDYALLIKGRVQPRFNDQERLEFKVKEIHQLSEVREDLLRNIYVTVPVEELSQDFIDNLKELTKERGNVTLHFKIKDLTENISVEMFSRNKGIHLTNELINYLEENSAVQYSLS
jgi:DNA polymerase-3 subunit alpha